MDLLIAANTVTQPNSDIAPATGTPGWATDGDPTTNTLATQAPAWHYNMMMAEMLAIVKAAGITPSNTDWSQVLKAMQTIFAPAQRGVAPYSATLAQLIGGYPKYAIVVDATGVLWRSSADKNMTVPGADGAMWGLLFDGFATQEWSDDRYQKSLGFVPVRQGGGVGQGANKVCLGWADDGSGLKCQVDGTDLGFVALRSDLPKVFVSAPQLIVGGMIYEIPHNLSAIPLTFGAYLSCVAQDDALNIGVGSQVQGYINDKNTAGWSALQIACNTGTLYFSTGDSEFGAIPLTTKANADITQIDTSKYRLVFWAAAL